MYTLILSSVSFKNHCKYGCHFVTPVNLGVISNIVTHELLLLYCIMKYIDTSNTFDNNGLRQTCLHEFKATLLEPCWNLPGNLAGTLREPCWNLPGTFLRPCWNLPCCNLAGTCRNVPENLAATSQQLSCWVSISGAGSGASQMHALALLEPC